MTGKKFTGNSRTGGILFFLICPFLLYLPVIDKYFVSDDFKVLSRVCLDQIILIKRFFRPLSDATIYLNYLAGGFHPLIFNSFNLLLHGLNAFLLYQFCLKIRLTPDGILSKQFAFLAAVLFMTYPFHNEGVVWLLGRGASMSCVFALSGMLAALSQYRLSKRILLTCSCYFIGLLAYESIMLFPVIVLLLVWIAGASRKEKALWVIGLLLTLFIHLTVRTLISGSIAGLYGEGFFKSDATLYLLNIAKTAGRLILPPTGEAAWLIYIYMLILIAVTVLSFFLIRQKSRSPLMKVLTGLFFCLCLACITPVFSGISTNSSESDRMLYFPSVFLCVIVSILLTFFITGRWKKLLICGLLLAYNIFFLEKNNFHWAIAGESSQSLIKLLKNKPAGKTYVMDIPEEYKGAYIFRQGLNDALRINGIASSQVIAVNYLTRKQADEAPRSITGQLIPGLDKDDEIIFWNGRSFIRLDKKTP